MKILRLLISVILLSMFVRFTGGETTPAPSPISNLTAPQYNPSTEITLKGTVTEISDRVCPISGGMGFHFILKTADAKTIEVHVATSKFVKDFEMGVKVGDQVEVLGSKVKFEGEDTIMARQITRGNDVFVFRYKDGKPAW